MSDIGWWWWAQKIAVGLVMLAALAYFTKWVSDSGVEKRARAAKELAENIEVWKIPRKVSEANGCEIWTFNADGKRWQYFTKCPGFKTVTTQTWETCQQVGKHRSCTEHRSDIPNDGGKYE